jgi:hypothetical protein
MRRAPQLPRSSSPGTTGLSDLGDEGMGERAYHHAIDKNAPTGWHVFHRPGDLLLTAVNEPESIGIRSFQAGLRPLEVIARGYPRFSHALMCVMPGLFMESNPVSLFELDQPAVKFLRAEDLPKFRSDFLVLRHRQHSAEHDFGVKILLRSIFHGDKPYHLLYLGEDKDRLFCSELVATMYQEAGKCLVPDRECRRTLPFDVEGNQRTDGWMDVTKLYIYAEDLFARGLMTTEEPDSRDMHLRQYEASSDTAEGLKKLAEAATDFVKDYDRQMSRPVSLPVDEPPRSYVGNVRDLVRIFKKHYPTYLHIKRYKIDGPAPERMRYNAMDANQLISELNQVADRLTNLARTTIAVVFSGFRSECVRFLAPGPDAEKALGEDMAPDERRAHADNVAKHISQIATYQPESEVEEGFEILAEVEGLLEAMKAVEPPPGCGP